METRALDLLIVGAGPAGLLASIIASALGLSYQVIEKRSGLHPEPSAHVIKTHSMEVYRRVGVAAAIIKEATPIELQECVTWCESLKGLTYGRLDLRGMKGAVPRFTQISPMHSANVPQNELEPLLYAHAKACAGRDSVSFSTNLVEFEEDRDGVRATVEDSSGRRQIRARYIIGADGASSQVRRSAGISMIGPPAIAHFLAIHIRSDARSITERSPGVVFFIRQRTFDGFFILHRPVGSQVFMMRFDPEKTPFETYDEAACRKIIEKAVGDEHEFEISTIDRWAMSAQVAEHYRSGRAILIGDAGHRFPPTGGLGLNTGVEDIENVVWKIAAVLRGQADERLLDSYELECRPIAVRNTNQSVKNNSRMQDIERAIDADKGDEAFRVALEELRQDPNNPRFELIRRAVENQIDHFAHLELEMAARMNEGAFVLPDRDVPLPVAPRENYQPSFMPGSHIPHFWIKPDFAALDVLRFDSFTLFCPESDASLWERAVAALPKASMPVNIVTINGDMCSEIASVADYWGPEPFAFLVRPDGRIAWVEPSDVGDRARALADAIAAIMSGEIAVLKERAKA